MTTPTRRAGASKAGQLSYSSSGIYGALHMPMEMLMHAAKLKIRHVPTTGGGPAIATLLGGQVDLTAGGPAAISPHVKAGKLRPLASWGSKRHEGFPDVPTFKQLGYDIEYLIWAGLFAPKATPECVMKVLHDTRAQSCRRSGLQRHDGESEFAGSVPRRARVPEILDGRWKRLADVVKVVGKVEAKK